MPPATHASGDHISDPSRTSPPPSSDVESALAIVCSPPSADREDRRADVAGGVSQALSGCELEDGVGFSFPNTDSVAYTLLSLILAERNCFPMFHYELVFAPSRRPIELRVKTMGELIVPLKSLYLGLARDSGLDV